MQSLSGYHRPLEPPPEERPPPNELPLLEEDDELERVSLGVERVKVWWWLQCLQVTVTST
jgi:hypothetical protein